MWTARLIVCFSLVASVYCKIYEYTDAFVDVMPRENCDADWKPMSCEEPGYFCGDCKNIYNCEYNDNDVLNGTCYKKCSGTQLCFNALCSDKPNGECSPEVTDYKIECNEPGIFPHPHDCKKYFICSEKDQATPVIPALYESTIYTCNGNFVFDPATLRCSKIQVGKCPMPIKLCESSRVGPIPGNPRLSYACSPKENGEGFTVKMSYCKDNYQYIAGRCTDPEKNMNVDPTTNKCTAKGMFHAKNCKQYNECTVKDAIAILRTCPLGQKFNITTNPNPVCQELTC